MSDTKQEFSVGQQVVFPSQGVGKITSISEEDFRGEKILYYHIYIEVSDTEALIPVDRAKIKGIRPIVSAEEAQKAIELLSDNSEPITSDWKLRYQMNLDLLKKGSINDIAAIVRCLYNRSKIKELPILERKLYDNAKKLLEDEISFAMEISTKEAESLIHSKLEPPGAVHEQKRILDDLDDDDDEFDDETDSAGDDDSDDDDADDKVDSDSSDDEDDDDEDFDD